MLAAVFIGGLSGPMDFPLGARTGDPLGTEGAPGPEYLGARGGPDAGSEPVISPQVRGLIDYVDGAGGPPPDYVTKPYANDGRRGGQVLPTHDLDGAPISYTEHDVSPYVPGTNRGDQRVVIGSDGGIYYTTDHYTTFVRVR